MSAAGPSLRRIAVPAEHGGWSLTLEPVLLGLLVAPGWPGVGLGVAALVAFVLRTPLKLSVGDRLRGRRLDRTGLADRLVAAEVVVLALALTVAAFGGWRLWLPLLAAVPLLAIELWYDVRSRSRRLVPELAGAVGIGSVAAAIALAGNVATPEAWSLWTVVAGRSVASIPHVRSQLARGKGRDVALGAAVAVQIGVATAVLAAAMLGAAPSAGALAVAVSAVWHIAALALPPPRTPVLGAQQVAIGLGIVVAAALGVRAP